MEKDLHIGISHEGHSVLIHTFHPSKVEHQNYLKWAAVPENRCAQEFNDDSSRSVRPTAVISFVKRCWVK